MEKKVAMKATQINTQGIIALAAAVIRTARLSEAKTAVMTAREMLNGIYSDDEFIAWVKGVLSE